MIVSRLRVEEKLLLAAFKQRGLNLVEVIDDGSLVLNPLAPDPTWLEYDLILQRSVSTSRSLYTLQVLESWRVSTLNCYQVTATCADKLRTTIALAQARVTQPPVRLAFSQEATVHAIEELEYPAVLKPTVGSWGRLLARVTDRYAAEAVLEHRHTLGSFPSRVRVGFVNNHRPFGHRHTFLEPPTCLGC